MGDSLNCQRCRQPLIRDASIANLTASQYALIAGTLPAQPPASALSPEAKIAQQPTAAKSAAAAWASANPIAESYVLLPDLAPGTTSSGSGRGGAGSRSSPPVRGGQGTATGGGRSSPRPSSPAMSGASPGVATPALAAKLDQLLSSRTNIDHPLCTECTGLFQAELQRELEELTRERDAYINFERNLRRRAEEHSGDVTSGSGEEGQDLIGDESAWTALQARRKELEEEERQLRVTLKEKESELAIVREDEDRVKAEEKAVEKEEEEFLTSHAALSTQLGHLSHQLSSAKTQLLLSTSLLQHLESTNVYNDAFQIGHAPLQPDSGASGSRGGVTVGTINGLRLGGRPLVDWDEINAAWGLVALCIDRLAAKVGCTFASYKIVPLGSFSRIEELPGKGVYELYASSDISPARLLQNRRFNYALVALLDCLRQLIEYGDKTGRNWGQGGIEITKDKINGHSIRLPGFTSNLPAFGVGSIMGIGSSSSPSPGSSGTTAANTAANSAAAGNPDEGWTRACRAVLQVLKRILVVESQAVRT